MSYEKVKDLSVREEKDGIHVTGMTASNNIRPLIWSKFDLKPEHPYLMLLTQIDSGEIHLGNSAKAAPWNEAVCRERRLLKQRTGFGSFWDYSAYLLETAGREAEAKAMGLPGSRYAEFCRRQGIEKAVLRHSCMSSPEDAEEGRRLLAEEDALLRDAEERLSGQERTAALTAKGRAVEEEMAVPYEEEFRGAVKEARAWMRISKKACAQ